MASGQQTKIDFVLRNCFSLYIVMVDYVVDSRFLLACPDQVFNGLSNGCVSKYDASIISMDF